MPGMRVTELATRRAAPELRAPAWCADSRREQAGLQWILLLDDDPINTRALSRWIKAELGAETRSATTIQQALCWLRSMPAPLAIITDFDLSYGETGVGALGEFGAHGIEAPAALLTGAPARALTALSRSKVSAPVFCKANYQDSLRGWLLTQVARRGRHAPSRVAR